MNATDFRIGNLAKFRISDDVSESWRASRVDLDPEIANIVNDNYSKLLDDLTETHNVEQGDKYKLPDLDFSVSRKIREKY